MISNNIPVQSSNISPQFTHQKTSHRQFPFSLGHQQRGRGGRTNYQPNGGEGQGRQAIHFAASEAIGTQPGEDEPVIHQWGLNRFLWLYVYIYIHMCVYIISYVYVCIFIYSMIVYWDESKPIMTMLGGIHIHLISYFRVGPGVLTAIWVW